MATATKKTRTNGHVARQAAAVSESAPMEFLVSENNAGDYHWTILGSGGESLAHSLPFATYDDAARAARLVRDGAGSAIARDR
jgi:uncharacterized protein YegP (UPF0339 family)